jgi:hypothetical protein
LPLGNEKTAKNFQATLRKDPPKDDGVVVETLCLREIVGTASKTSHGWISNADDHPANPGHDASTGAHGAGLLGRVQNTLGQPPITDGGSGSPQHQHFSMGRWISSGSHAVMVDGEDFFSGKNHRTDGHFVFLKSKFRRIDGQFHAKNIPIGRGLRIHRFGRHFSRTSEIEVNGNFLQFLHSVRRKKALNPFSKPVSGDAISSPLPASQPAPWHLCI